MSAGGDRAEDVAEAPEGYTQHDDAGGLGLHDGTELLLDVDPALATESDSRSRRGSRRLAAGPDREASVGATRLVGEPVEEPDGVANSEAPEAGRQTSEEKHGPRHLNNGAEGTLYLAIQGLCVRRGEELDDALLAAVCLELEVTLVVGGPVGVESRDDVGATKLSLNHQDGALEDVQKAAGGSSQFHEERHPPGARHR